MPFLKQRIHFKQCELWLVLDIMGLILSQEKWSGFGQVILVSHLLVALPLQESVLLPLVDALLPTGCVRPQLWKLIRSS